MTHKELFTWLPNSVRKQVPYLPHVEVVEELNDALGYYQQPHEEYPRGLLVVEYADDKLLPATLAHEFRHHWQVFNFIRHNSRKNWYDYCVYEYEEAIFRYFTELNTERDALLFEYKYTRTDLNEYWLKGIVNNGANYKQRHNH